MYDKHCRLSIFSFDFKQDSYTNQARKTQFFRRLYGYTQRVSRRLKSGRVVTYSYQYPGLLDQYAHVKLGKSVFGMLPGNEGPVMELFEAFQEVTYFNFIGWVQVSDCKEIVELTSHKADRIIERFGFLSILLIAAQHNGRFHLSNLTELGFDSEYIRSAIDYLRDNGLVEDELEEVVCTPSGIIVARSLVSTKSISF